MIYTSNDAHKTSSSETVWMSWQTYLHREKSLQKNLPSWRMIILSNHHGTQTNLVVKQATCRKKHWWETICHLYLTPSFWDWLPAPTFLHTHPQYAWHHPVIWTPARRGKEHLVPFHYKCMEKTYTWKTKCTFFFRHLWLVVGVSSLLQINSNWLVINR